MTPTNAVVSDLSPSLQTPMSTEGTPRSHPARAMITSISINSPTPLYAASCLPWPSAPHPSPGPEATISWSTSSHVQSLESTASTISLSTTLTTSTSHSTYIWGSFHSHDGVSISSPLIYNSAGDLSSDAMSSSGRHSRGPGTHSPASIPYTLTVSRSRRFNPIFSPEGSSPKEIKREQ